MHVHAGHNSSHVTMCYSGGTVDYGEEHSRKKGHNRFGRSYQVSTESCTYVCSEYIDLAAYKAFLGSA